MYEITDVPAEAPAVTSPEASTEAIPGAVLVHAPPGGELLSGIVPRIHKLVPPVMAVGNGLMVSIVVLEHPVGMV